MKERLTVGETDAERPILGRTKDGALVRDRKDSHFHPEGGLTYELLESALSTIETNGENRIVKQVDFDRQIGVKTSVDVDQNDNIEMVFRKGRSGLTSMVHGREPQPTNSVVVVLAKDHDYPDDYALITSFTGELATREPWDPGIESGEEFAEAEKYWNSHALLYDENLIDKERTEAFRSAPEEEKRVELLRQKVMYAGIFVDVDELYKKAPTTLAKPIKAPHVTTNFRPDSEQLHLSSLGSGAKIIAIGYGNDGKNEGLLVRVEADDPEIQAACDVLERPHITLSLAEGAVAKDTVNLEFSKLDEPFELTGEYGLFSQGKIIKNLERNDSSNDGNQSN